MTTRPTDLMDSRLQRLISDYQARVAEAVDMLEAVGIMRPTSSTEWVIRDMPYQGELGDGVSYAKHGIGCAVRGRNWSIDFDFGARGEFDGFDPWRLWSFGGRHQGRYFKTEAALFQAFQEAVDAREFVKLENLYYVPLRRPTR